MITGDKVAGYIAQWTKYDGPGYVCGDADGNGTCNLGDCQWIINYIFYDGPAPDPIELGDADGDGSTNLGDCQHIINYIFYDGPPPVCP